MCILSQYVNGGSVGAIERPTEINKSSEDAIAEPSRAIHCNRAEPLPVCHRASRKKRRSRKASELEPSIVLTLTCACQSMACTGRCPFTAPPAAPAMPDFWEDNSHGILLGFLSTLNAFMILLICAYLIHRRLCARHVSETVAAETPRSTVPYDRDRLRRLQETLALLPALTPNEAAELSSDCAICLADFCDDDRMASLLPCGHTLHKECLEKWTLHRPHAPKFGGSMVRSQDRCGCLR